jgi:alanine racemase
MPRPLIARIDLPALRHNFALARRRAGSARVWAVLKANAYGHGLLQVALALAEADGFAVVEFDAAQRLREAGVTHPLLLLQGPFGADDWRLATQLGLSLVLHDEAQLAMLAGLRLTRPVPVWLKFDADMHRLGFPLSRAESMLQRVAAEPRLQLAGTMTHLANADVPDGSRSALEAFCACSALCGLPRAAANSAALLQFPAARLDWVRPGIMLYGASPLAGQSAKSLDLQPVMRLSTELIAVRDIAAGDAIGYGGSFVAPAAMRIGVVACGYADGYLRMAPVGTPVLVDGQRVPLVGRVSMDMMMVDVSRVPNAQVGSVVELWGDKLPADEVAAAWGTVAYELFASLTARVPLRYV